MECADRSRSLKLGLVESVTRERRCHRGGGESGAGLRLPLESAGGLVRGLAASFCFAAMRPYKTCTDLLYPFLEPTVLLSWS